MSNDNFHKTPVRLALFLNLPVEEVDGKRYARYPHLFEFFSLLASRTDETVFFVPYRRVKQVKPGSGEVELSDNVRIVGLPYWDSAAVVARQIHRIAPATLKLAWREIKKVDAVG